MASSSDQNPLLPGMKLLPSALIATITSKLDIRSIQSLASTCKTFRSYAAHILSFVPTFHLFVRYNHILGYSAIDEFVETFITFKPILEKPKGGCTRLDDFSLDFLIHPSLQELCLYNCADCTRTCWFFVKCWCDFYSPG
ncbi:unnamed protein product [Fraxinus pennsylvanica]|uniref:F-box domain-containing protein n=1 Tax=Fraxinus pennsylvanica TaxID=56036 RepID=A0AAD2DIR3_9LAMI|nr:unnamed protein product [Fraxinus pennsylvanica]